LNKQKAVRLRLYLNYGQLRRATTGRQISSPLVPLGLHGLFTCLHAINTVVVFLITHFYLQINKLKMQTAQSKISDWAVFLIGYSDSSTYKGHSSSGITDSIFFFFH
jgi:hypothetical protein